MVTYLIEATSATEARKLGREKILSLPEYPFEEKDIVFCRATETKENSENEIIEDINEKDYEVSFNININGAKYRKTLIIRAENEEDAKEKTSSKCNKEFSGIRSITKMEAKEADENSKESSELIEPLKIIPLNNDKKEKTYNKVDTFSYVNGLFRKSLEENLNLLPKEIAEIKVAEIITEVKGKKFKELFDAKNLKNTLIIKAESKQEAEDFVNNLEKELNINRELRRHTKRTISLMNFESILRKFVTKEINKKMEEAMSKGKISKFEFITEESNKEITELEDKVKQNFKEKVFDACKDALLETLEESDNEKEKEKYKKVEIDTDLINSIDVLTNDEGDITTIIKKNSLLIVKKKFFKCTMILRNNELCNSIDVEANSNEEAIKLLQAAIIGEFFEGLNFEDVKTVTISSKESDKLTTIDIHKIEKLK